MSRLNPRRHACFSRGCVFEYDDLTVHGNHNPHNARGGALLIHRPAWVDQHTGVSLLTPTVHPCPKGMAVGGSSPQHKAQHTVHKHGKHGSGALETRALVTRVCCAMADPETKKSMRRSTRTSKRKSATRSPVREGWSKRHRGACLDVK